MAVSLEKVSQDHASASTPSGPSSHTPYDPIVLYMYVYSVIIDPHSRLQSVVCHTDS